MIAFIAGATGATGRQLVRQLLDNGHAVRTIVRSKKRLIEAVGSHERLSISEASLLDLSDTELAEHLTGCGSVASCLGHNMSLKGIYGKPRRLVADAVMSLCNAIRDYRPDEPVRFVLMNTTGNRNLDLNEPRSVGETLVIGSLGILLPPQADNEAAANYLRTEIGKSNSAIEWTAVRPDSLIDESEVSDYELYPSPIRSPIFNAGKTSRINVAHFMSRLMTEDETWAEWKGRMPVIYNKISPAPA